MSEAEDAARAVALAERRRLTEQAQKARAASVSIRGAPNVSIPAAAHGGRSFDWEKDKIEAAVRKQRMTPADAENWASENKRPFAQQLENHAWDFEKRLWPLPLAIIWVAFRDTEHAAKAWAQFNFWGGHIYRNPLCEGQRLTFAKSEFDVFEALGSGKVTAEGHRGGGRIQTISATNWYSAQWSDDLVQRSMIMRNGDEYYEIVIPQMKVRGAWPALMEAGVPEGGDAKADDRFPVASMSKSGEPVALTLPTRPRGKPRIQGDRILAEMRAMDRTELSVRPETS